MAEYTNKPLAEKLGIKSGFSIAVWDAPAHYWALVNPLPVDVSIKPLEEKPFDLIHAFFKERLALEINLPVLKTAIVANGAVWVSWPKKASKIPTNLTDTVVRDIAIANGLVDVKVCSVDDVWSGLKLVIRLKDRTQK